MPGNPANNMNGYVPGNAAGGMNGYVPGTMVNNRTSRMPGNPAHGMNSYVPGNAAGGTNGYVPGSAPSVTTGNPSFTQGYSSVYGIAAARVGAFSTGATSYRKSIIR